MSIASRSDVLSTLGELDDALLARIVGLEASADEVRQAREWLYSNSIERREASPAGRVAKIVALLQDELDADTEELMDQ